MFLEVENGPIMLGVDFSALKDNEGTEIVLKHVWVGHSNGRLDILNALSNHEREEIIKECHGYED